MSTVSKRFLEIFCDNNGRLSSMRIAFFVLLFSEVFNQTFSTINGHYTPMNMEGMVSLGVAFLAKTWQKGIETKYDGGNNQC